MSLGHSVVRVERRERLMGCRKREQCGLVLYHSVMADTVVSNRRIDSHDDIARAARLHKVA
jgi:hypothetical protein